MPFRSILVGAFTLVLTGCGIPPVDTSTISQIPASAQSFAVAKRAVRACANAPEGDRVLTALRRSGFKVSGQRISVRGGLTTTRYNVQAPDDRVSVLYHGNDCFVGLENMTPEQSRALAEIWVAKYNARPNSAYGDGLSDHVSGAWRRFFIEPAAPPRAPFEHRIYIAAYKTWPSGPYDPQRKVPFDIEGLFPNTAGAAVKLTYALECDPIVKTGEKSGAILNCDRSRGGSTGSFTYTLN